MNEDAVLTAALEVFREVRQRHAALRTKVQESQSQARAGGATPFSIEETQLALRDRVARLVQNQQLEG